jgi:hypothetical protein
MSDQDIKNYAVKEITWGKTEVVKAESWLSANRFELLAGLFVVAVLVCLVLRRWP